MIIILADKVSSGEILNKCSVKTNDIRAIGISWV